MLDVLPRNFREHTRAKNLKERQKISMKQKAARFDYKFGHPDLPFPYHPWDWYLHEWLILMLNVRKYTSSIDVMRFLNIQNSTSNCNSMHQKHDTKNKENLCWVLLNNTQPGTLVTNAPVRGQPGPLFNFQKPHRPR